jgi:hypothetical protein
MSLLTAGSMSTLGFASPCFLFFSCVWILGRGRMASSALARSRAVTISVQKEVRFSQEQPPNIIRTFSNKSKGTRKLKIYATAKTSLRYKYANINLTNSSMLLSLKKKLCFHAFQNCTNLDQKPIVDSNN